MVFIGLSWVELGAWGLTVKLLHRHFDHFLDVPAGSVDDCLALGTVLRTHPLLVLRQWAPVALDSNEP